jgi:2-amino-4-hydroxy-6-hydroxymethyldihydropteridine diphosphokinase
MEPGRQIRRAAIALGANLGDRRATLERAVALIGAEIGPVEARSGWLETAAMIHPDDPAQSYPAFINGVLLASTPLAPLEVLDRLHGIEARLGRDRNAETARWRPRLIDLDLIAVEDLVLDTPRLQLPHPEMYKRRFVLAPLVEVWPDWRHPLLGATAADLLDALPPEELDP